MAPIRLLGSATAVLGLALCAACSAAAPPASTATAAAPASAAGPAGPDPDAACAALPPFDAVVFTYPSGGDPDAPKPSADALRQWAATAVGPVGELAAAAPPELAAPVATLRAAIDGAARGTPVDPADQQITTAASTVDKWAYDHCGFGTLDVTGTGTELPGVPATLPAGPLAVRFDNGGDPAAKGFVLLVARVRDGAQYTLDGIRDGSVDFNSIADVVGAAQPPAGEPTGYAVSTLTPGRYLVVSPIGTPPQFTGTAAAEFTVT
jgi:hypothetical protein